MNQTPYNMVKVPLPEVTKIILTGGVGDKLTVEAIDVCLETDWYTAFTFRMGRG